MIHSSPNLYVKNGLDACAVVLTLALTSLTFLPGVVAIQSLSEGAKGWRVSATGVVLELDAELRIVKKLKLVRCVRACVCVRVIYSVFGCLGVRGWIFSLHQLPRPAPGLIHRGKHIEQL
jgi:hypothetical protein